MIRDHNFGSIGTNTYGVLPLVVYKGTLSLPAWCSLCIIFTGTLSILIDSPWEGESLERRVCSLKARVLFAADSCICINLVFSGQNAS